MRATRRDLEALAALELLRMDTGRIPCAGCGMPIQQPGENPDPDALLCDSCFGHANPEGAVMTPHATFRDVYGFLVTVYRSEDGTALELFGRHMRRTYKSEADMLTWEKEAARTMRRFEQVCVCGTARHAPLADWKWRRLPQDA